MRARKTDQRVFDDSMLSTFRKNFMHQWWKIAFRLQNPRLKSTLVYPHLVNFEGDEYHTATSKSLKEDEELLKAGFEYVTERDEIKIYRKRK